MTVELHPDGWKFLCNSSRHKRQPVPRCTLSAPPEALPVVLERLGWKSNTDGDKHYCPDCQRRYADPTR